MYHSKENLFTYIQDVHQTDHTHKCPLCEEKVYTSEGGYYKNLRVTHNISCQTVKLSEYMKAQGSRKSEDEEEQSETDEKSQPKPKHCSKRSRSSGNTEDKPDTLAKKPKKKDTVDDEPENTDKNKAKKKDKVAKEPENTEKKKSKNTGKLPDKDEDKRKKIGKGSNDLKRKDDQKDKEKPKIPESYLAKHTRSSGPVTWDCPFCEDIKYTDNLDYLVHLQKKHKCGLLYEHGQKDKEKVKDNKGKKGKGKK